MSCKNSCQRKPIQIAFTSSPGDICWMCCSAEYESVPGRRRRVLCLRLWLRKVVNSGTVLVPRQRRAARTRSNSCVNGLSGRMGQNSALRIHEPRPARRRRPIWRSRDGESLLHRLLGSAPPPTGRAAASRSDAPALRRPRPTAPTLISLLSRRCASIPASGLSLSSAGGASLPLPSSAALCPRSPALHRP